MNTPSCVLAHLRVAVRSVVLATIVATPLIAQNAAPGGGELSRDEALWREIVTLHRDADSSTPYVKRLDATLCRRRQLLERVRAYLTAYPGGSHRDDAVHIELEALFDVGMLSGKGYEELHARVQEYLQHPPSEAARHEAAYWEMCCQRVRRGWAASQPTSAPVKPRDPELLEAYRRYVKQYPTSRYVPRLVAKLFDDAEARGDLGDMSRLADVLMHGFPQHLITQNVTARLRRGETIGKPFALTFKATDGRPFDIRAWRGDVVLVVFWSAEDPPSRTCVAEIEAFRRKSSHLKVVGINLDADIDEMNRSCRELGLKWPQMNDGLGRGNQIALQWGVRKLPLVLVVNRDGLAVGWSGLPGWRALAASILDN